MIEVGKSSLEFANRGVEPLRKWLRSSMTGDALRREADQHDRNASIILSVQLPSYEDLEYAAREVELAKDKRALADCLDSARTEQRIP